MLYTMLKGHVRNQHPTRTLRWELAAYSPVSAATWRRWLTWGVK